MSKFIGVTADEVVDILSRQLPSGQSEIVGMKIGTKVLEAAEIMPLKHEADMIGTSKLWKLLINRVRYIAHLNSCEKAKSFEDVVYSKAMLYSIDEIQRILGIVQAFETTKVVGDKILDAKGK